MAGIRRTGLLVALATIAVVALVAVCIYFGSRRNHIELTPEEVREIVHNKNVGLGELENQKLAEAIQSFEPLIIKLPDDPLAARNVAVARVVALGTEDKPEKGELIAELTAQADRALARSKRIEGELIAHHWLALHIAFLSQNRADAEAHVGAILKEYPDDAAAWYASYRTFKIGFPENLDPGALRHINEACRCDPQNTWLRVEWLRALDDLIRQGSTSSIDVAETTKQLELTAQAIAPFAHLIKEDVASLIASAKAAITSGDFDAAYGPLFGLANVVAPHANPDLRTAKRHPLEFVLDDFQPTFYQTHPIPEAETAAPVPVEFKSSPLSLAAIAPSDSPLIAVDLALVDFDLDGWLDVVAVGPATVAVWGRKSPQDPWKLIASAEVSGFDHVLAQDYDADFDETFSAVYADWNPAQSKDLPTLENVCPTADADLVLYGPSGVLLLENRYDAATKQRSLVPIPSQKLPAGLQNVTAAAAVDLEADGHLDLLLADESGLHFWSLASTWKFVEISSRSTLPGKSTVTQLLPVDLDRDVDMDVVVASPDGAGYLENLRHGQFRWRPFERDFAPLRTARAIEVADIDGNASWDLVAATAEGLLLVTTKTPDTGVIRLGASATISDTLMADGLLAWDYDNDGLEDLLATSSDGVQALRGMGSNQFSPIPLFSPADEIPRRVLTGDFDNDGDFDAATVGNNGLTLWDNEGGSANHWLNVALQALQDKNEEKAPSGRVSPWGNGSLLELKSAQRYQAKIVRGQVAHFGLGKAAAADVVRVVWINGVPQNILRPKAKLFLCERQTLNTSCPYLYTWDGEQFVFATDLLWNSPLGLQLAKGVLAQPREWEYLKVPGEQLAAKDGHYVLQLTEELWEAAYFDQVRLIAIDHPADTAIYSNEKVGPAEISQHQVHTVRNSHPLRSAKNHQGRDLTAEVATADGNYARVHEKKFRQGVTEESYLELDLGDVSGAKQITLFLTGWIYPSSTSINVALSQGGDVPPPKPPALWVPDGNGGWKEALPFMGFPGGKTKTIAVDLSGLLAANDGRVRIATTMEFYWDHIFFSADEPAVDIQTTELPLVSAELHDRGYSRVVPGENHGPEQYLYHDVSTEPKWPTMPGSFTPLGNVKPLLKDADDRLLVIGAGDEVTLRFKAPNEPLPKGWKRDFFFYSHGWEKDCNLLTVLGETADTLPFAAMRGYPWPADQQAPKRIDPLTRQQSPAFWKTIQRW